MKIVIIERNRKIAYTIKAILEILGFQPILKEKKELKSIRTKILKLIILNTNQINKKNKDYLNNFIRNEGKLLLYGNPKNKSLFKKTFGLEIVKKKQIEAYGYVGRNLVKNLEKNKYYNERKIPFCLQFSVKWKNSKKYGQILDKPNKSPIVYFDKSQNNIAYLAPEIFQVAYSLLTDQNSTYREGIFKRQFPLDSLLYVYIQILYSIIKKLFNKYPVITKWYWPNRFLSAITITHDVDTQYDLKAGIESFRKLEKKYNVTSTWNFRPGDRYELSKKLMKDLISQGCEIGLHSINKAITNLDEFKRQKEFIESFTKSTIFGVRAHSLYRIPIVTQEVVKKANMLYDSTIPDTDNCVNDLQKFKGNTIFFPYLYYFTINNPEKPLVILPLTIHDWWYIAGNNWSAKKTMEFYKKKTEYIINKNGLNVVLLHAADYMTGGQRIWMYDRFLNYITKIPKLWISNSISIANWFIERKKIKYDYRYQNGILSIRITKRPNENKEKVLPLLIYESKKIKKIEVFDTQNNKKIIKTEKFNGNQKLIYL